MVVIVVVVAITTLTGGESWDEMVDSYNKNKILLEKLLGKLEIINEK